MYLKKTDSLSEPLLNDTQPLNKPYENVNLRLLKGNFNRPLSDIFLYFISPTKWCTFLALICSFILAGQLFFSLRMLFLFSILVLLPFMFACQYATQHRYLFNVFATTFEVNDELCASEFLHVHQNLPWCWRQSDVESADWINSLINVLWQHAQYDLHERLQRILGKQLSLDTYLGEGNALSQIYISNFSLGNQGPVLNGVRLLRQGVSREELALELELEFNENICINIRGAYGLELGINSVFARCQVRILIAPLFRQFPALGAICVQLLRPPTLHTQLTGFAAPILNLLRWPRVIAYLLYSWFGEPAYIQLNIASRLPIKTRYLPEPRLLLRVDLLEALNLLLGIRKKFFYSYAEKVFVELRLGEQIRRSRAVNATAYPEWTQSFVFICDQTSKARDVYSQKLIIKVLLKSRRSYVILAKCELHLSHFLSSDSLLNGREIEAPLKALHTAHVTFNEVKQKLNKRVQLVGQTCGIVLRISSFKLVAERCLLRQRFSNPPGWATLPLAVLSVLVDSASGLETAARHSQTPELRPLVRVCVGNQQKVTNVQERTGYPVWEETLQFLLYNPKLEDVHVEIVDMYYVLEKKLWQQLMGKKLTGDLKRDWLNLSREGIVIGYCTLPVVDTLSSHRMQREGTFQLEGYAEHAYIHLTLAVCMTEENEQIRKNINLPRIALPEDVLRCAS